ncbi:SUN domain-containing protein 1-like [Punica granatum]|uniref:SUN domain-containing protein 1-like n=1 Tax=Punica granatum TaxID=22663 RepID=A0A6P8BVL0_PUNGR|nr:SUN domain-containing protein 1-like [Punica granatum]
MSASTVSITANPATARRRPVVVTDKKSSAAIDLIAVENGPNGAAAVDKVAAASSKDLSHHSIRGDAKDLATVKKTAGNSTVSPRRVRKAPLKPEKPWWLTGISIFAKNFLLLIVILGLVQLIRRLSLQTSGTNPVVLTDFEGRIAEVEGLLKKTSKMIQVQVDVVDKKVESGIGNLRSELSRKIEDKSATMESELKRLEAKSDSLEGYLIELRGKEWLPKEEFDRFVGDLKKAKGAVGSSDGMSLDDIKAYARDVVLKEIEKHAADGLARVDYALATGGAIVSGHSEPYGVGKGNWFSASSRNGVHSGAYKMLRPSFGEPGACFPLKGNSGFVEIRLRTAIVPEAVTLEHVAKSVAYDRSSAPKDCRVSGWYRGNTDSAAMDADKMYLLTEFTYDLEKSNAQTFNVLDSTAAPGIIDTVKLDIASNHGSPTHTCIYRFRVHGHEPSTESLLGMQS